MNNAEKAAAVIQDAGGRVIGRTKLQKITYLLCAAGLEDGFDFEYRHYGPYSENLSDAIAEARLGGLVSEDERSDDKAFRSQCRSGTAAARSTGCFRRRRCPRACGHCGLSGATRQSRSVEGNCASKTGKSIGAARPRSGAARRASISQSAVTAPGDLISTRLTRRRRRETSRMGVARSPEVTAAARRAGRCANGSVCER